MKPIPTRAFTDELLNPYRQRGDRAADAVVAEIAPKLGHEGLGRFMRYLGDFQNLSWSEQLPEVQVFFQAHSQVPVFANQAQMQAAVAFFWKHSQQIALLLGCYSLPYCYAAADGAQVLWFSERIKNDTFKRLEETGTFVFEIMQERDWLNGKNPTKVLKIRLMHAVVRYFASHAKQWNNAWGVPINQEDMAGTNLAFSYIVIRGLRKLEIATTEAEEEAYLHFWSVIGALLGVETELLPLNLREAYHLDRAICRRQFKPSDAGTGLTKALTKVLQQQAPEPALRNFPLAQMRFLLGNDIANLLNIPKVPLEEGVVKFTTGIPLLKLLFSPPRVSTATLEKYQRF